MTRCLGQQKSAKSRAQCQFILTCRAIVLLVAYRPAWLSRLSAFGVTGVMALTNYLLRVIVIDLVFSNYALALEMSATYALLAALVLFAIDVALSRWWLARFRYGPLEWVWRSATYWKRQPMRLRGSA